MEDCLGLSMVIYEKSLCIIVVQFKMFNTLAWSKTFVKFVHNFFKK